MHYCPECGMACDCGDDVEDHDTGEPEHCECDHEGSGLTGDYDDIDLGGGD